MGFESLAWITSIDTNPITIAVIAYMLVLSSIVLFLPRSK